MNLTTLLKRLLEIEQSLDVETNLAVHKQMQDVQDYVLQMQKQLVSKLHNENPRHAA